MYNCFEIYSLKKLNGKLILNIVMIYVLFKLRKKKFGIFISTENT